MIPVEPLKSRGHVIGDVSLEATVVTGPGREEASHERGGLGALLSRTGGFFRDRFRGQELRQPA